MKKVRVVVGAGVPAVGMLIVPAAAHAATAEGTTAATAAVLNNACPPASTYSTGVSPHGHLFGYISNHGSCVNYQQATLNKGQTGLTERVRFETATGKITKVTRRSGIISGGMTFFFSSPNYHTLFVKQALVANGTNTLKYGSTSMIAI